MEKERVAVDGGSMRGLRLSACLAVLALFFCLGTGTCFSRDSAGLSGDITTYTGQAGSAQSQEGGSYLQVSRGWVTECYRPNARTNACSCPGGYAPRLVSIAQGDANNDLGIITWASHGFNCEK